MRYLTAVLILLALPLMAMATPAGDLYDYAIATDGDVSMTATALIQVPGWDDPTTLNISMTGEVESDGDLMVDSIYINGTNMGSTNGDTGSIAANGNIFKLEIDPLTHQINPIANVEVTEFDADTGAFEFGEGTLTITGDTWFEGDYDVLSGSGSLAEISAAPRHMVRASIVWGRLKAKHRHDDR